MLDLRTIYIIVAVTLLCLGVFHLAAASSGRVGRWLTLWGAAYSLDGIGGLLVGLRDSVPYWLSATAANAITLVSLAMLPAAARLFAGERVPVWRDATVTAAVIAVSVLVWGEPNDAACRVTLVSLFCAVLDLQVVAVALRLRWREGLKTANLMAALFGFSALLYLGRAVALATGGGGRAMFEREPPAHAWLAVVAAAVVVLRSVVILSMAAERDRAALRRLAEEDPLSGALNRTGLRARFHALMQAEAVVAVLVLDIDRFKSVNDTFGHAAGDELIRALAVLARDALPPDGVLGRQGGDEFVVLLPGGSVGEGMRLAEQLRERFPAAARERGLPMSPTLSIGVAQAGSGTTLDAVLAEADSALYRSKRSGRDRVHSAPEALAA